MLHSGRLRPYSQRLVIVFCLSVNEERKKVFIKLPTGVPVRPHRRRRQPVHPLQGGQQPHRLPLPRALRLLLQQREGRLQRPGVGARALHRSIKTGANRIKIAEPELVEFLSLSNTILFLKMYF
jgi:hypothetical protein